MRAPSGTSVRRLAALRGLSAYADSMACWAMTHSERIATTRRAIEQLEDTLSEAVAEARAAGATWDEVAASLGVARQSAWRRFKEERGVKQRKRCSFCGARQKDVSHLVVAPTGASICNACLDVAQSMVTATQPPVR